MLSQRQHLLLDFSIQLALLIYLFYSWASIGLGVSIQGCLQTLFLQNPSEAAERGAGIWLGFLLLNLLWQGAQAVVSVYVYDYPLRKTYLKYLGAILISLGVFFGLIGSLIWLGVTFYTLLGNWLLSLANLLQWILYFMYILWPWPTAFFVGWYYYLTYRELDTSFRNTI